MMSVDSMRLDKWLWAARFFKTRALAQKHIELGRVLVNGDKVKNSKMIAVGDVVDIKINSLPYKMTVMGLNQQRRPAPEARLLYCEDETVVTQRETMKALNHAAQAEHRFPEGRPTKRNRRQLDEFKRHFF
ncbi:MAG: RNA-binding S4 domain-containing protein [Neisseriaceae bacterium]|nr:RNA-binding S4 domain-containing protein [Neisseriaceae bacterium]MBQ9618953.1 RNA-binding S4 domain-containing protein [Neisseriaceae bacterium]